MPDKQQPSQPSGADMRRFILSCLGYNAGGLTQRELLGRFTVGCLAICGFEPGSDCLSQFIGELRAMRDGGRIVGNHIGGRFVHQHTPHGWLAWTRARQEEDAARAPARL